MKIFEKTENERAEKNKAVAARKFFLTAVIITGVGTLFAGITYASFATEKRYFGETEETVNIEEIREEVSEYLSEIKKQLNKTYFSDKIFP